MRATAALLVLPLLLAFVPTAAAEPTEVAVGIHVINFGNYDPNKGTYVIDLYLFMEWNATSAPDGFTPEKFEFMNGRPTAKERLSDETDANGMRETWWRIQANLYSEPRFEDFPFDTQTIEILFEDALYQADELVYVPRIEESGVDADFKAAGWRIGEPRFEVLTKEYPFEESYSRGKLSIELSRERFSTSLKSMLPPLAFMFISGLSFFLHPSKVAQRLGLGTSMIISAVMFHISQTVSLPPLGSLILFDKLMLACYAFLLASLSVTTLIAIDEDYWKGSDHTKEINRWGAVASIALPLVVFAALTLL